MLFDLLVHVASDVTVVSVCLAGVRRVSGLSLKPMTRLIPNENARGVVVGILDIGEYVLERGIRIVKYNKPTVTTTAEEVKKLPKD